MGGGVDTIGGSPLEDELAALSLTFTEVPEELQHVSQDLIDAANKWKELQYKHMNEAGVLAKIDSGSMERGYMLYLNMMICQRDLMLHGYFYETESGRRENPAGPAFRAYSNQREKWEGQHAAYPMARHNKNMNLEPTGGTASHGNRKDPLLDIINE